ncbi:hypothetical protein [Aliikangiella coralliicola]|uniref:SGNH/GDSL hydrolase family protein n=1 Tax=Aliikangiella coralliicola TaxID=2592383 RepID=A0A545UDU4_9GAMM|nr:hypothetical protein [Aliikangiella coralliicola]TQV87644.1 hypothetical protein FLL46_12310 [Aliikangiella coralliicola]
MNKSLAFIYILLLISACGGSNTNDSGTTTDPLAGVPIGDYEVLFIGNSHSAANGLPNLVAILIEAGQPDKTANTMLAPGWGFLVDKLHDETTQQMLTGRAWTHVILQAQKYSTTGLYWYPTDASEEWIRRVKNQNAVPVMFPEWPRRGNTEEGLRVHNLHLEIASREPACVAPIGLAWEESIARYPMLNLHAPDGNHSNLTGALLTAYVFYQVITEQSAAELPFIQSINVSADVQQKLREVASFTVENHIPCETFEPTAG